MPTSRLTLADRDRLHSICRLLLLSAVLFTTLSLALGAASGLQVATSGSVPATPLGAALVTAAAAVIMWVAHRLTSDLRDQATRSPRH